MVFSSAILGMAAVASSYLVATAADDVKTVPWKGYDPTLTVDTLDTKYMTHILTMRNDTSSKVSDYVSIDPKGRTNAYNGDTSVIKIGVDAKAIFKAQNNFRRTELVQKIAVTSKPNLYRGSLMKEEAFLNPYVWQCFFTETHIFEIRVDATVSPPKIIYINNGMYEPKWEAPFKLGTWYNFGIAVSAAPSGKGSVLEFYTSEGDKELVLVATEEVAMESTVMEEFHIGLLTLTDDGSDPKMDAKVDYLGYNGVSVEAGVPSSATGAASTPSNGMVKSSDNCARTQS